MKKIRNFLKEVFYFEINAEPDGYMQVLEKRNNISKSFDNNDELEDYLSWVERNEELLFKSWRNYTANKKDFRVLTFSKFCEGVYFDEIPHIDFSKKNEVFV